MRNRRKGSWCSCEGQNLGEQEMWEQPGSAAGQEEGKLGWVKQNFPARGKRRMKINGLPQKIGFLQVWRCGGREGRTELWNHQVLWGTRILNPTPIQGQGPFPLSQVLQALPTGLGCRNPSCAPLLPMALPSAPWNCCWMTSRTSPPSQERIFFQIFPYSV